MRTLINSGIVVLAFIGLLACSKSSPTQVETASIFHTWEWQFSVGGLTGNDTMTPGKVGFTRRIEFSGDGMFKEYRNDTLFGVSQFVMSRQRTIFSLDSLQVIRFQDSTRFPLQIIWKVDRDTLALGDNHVEPYGHSYKRIGD